MEANALKLKGKSVSKEAPSPFLQSDLEPHSRLQYAVPPPFSSIDWLVIFSTNNVEATP